MSGNAKTVSLLLSDGTLQGVISLEGSAWNAGEMYSAPRESIQDLVATDACKKFGVYLLLSRDQVYIGQSSDLAKRLSQHIIGKDWWESAVILTTKDNSLTHSDIDYLESTLIAKAFAVNKLNCENKLRGNTPKVDKYREVYLKQYLDEALFLMKLIGITVFLKEVPRDINKYVEPGTPIIDTMETKTRLTLGRRTKKEALDYLKGRGVTVGKNVSYSGLRASDSVFWINPRLKMLSTDWTIVLNDNQSSALIVLSVPANSLAMKNDVDPGLVSRSDRPDLIDLYISRDTLIDRRSGIDFSPFLVDRVPY